MKLTSHWLLSIMSGILSDNEGDPAGGGAGAGGSGAAGTPGASATSAGNPGAAAATGDPAGTARTSAAPSGFTYTEDRSKWIPPHRFNEVNTRAQRATQLEADIAERDRKIAALAGVSTPDPNAAKADQVKDAFFQMFPQFRHLAALDEKQIQALIQTPQHVARATDAEKRQWERHGNQQINTIATKVADALGTEKLSDRQQGALRVQFQTWLRDKAASEIDAGGDSLTLRNYEAGDPAILDAFVKDFTDDFVTPARRQQTASTLHSRVRSVPSSQGRAQVSTVARPEKFKNMDERLDYAAQLYKERGGRFKEA